MVRRILRPFPAANGEAFYKKDGATSDRDILDPLKLNGRMTHMNEELMNRPGRGLITTAGSICELATYVSKYVKPESPSALDPTGLPAIREFFDNENGTKFWEAARYLNVSVSGPTRTKAATRNAISNLLEVSADESSFDVNAMQRLATFAAKMFTGAIKAIELVAIIRGDREHWALELNCQLPQHPSEVEDFVNDPFDDQALLEALVSCYHEQMVPEVETQNLGGFLDGDDADDPFGMRSDHHPLDDGREVRSATKRVSLLGSMDISIDTNENSESESVSKRTKVFSPKSEMANTKIIEGGVDSAYGDHPLEDWPLQELIAWKEQAEMQQSKNDFALLEARKQHEMLEAIPISLRKEYGVATTTVEFLTAEKNAKDNAEKLFDMVKNVQMAWISKAETFDANVHGWGLRDDLQPGQLLRKSMQYETLFGNRKQMIKIAEMIATLAKDDNQIDRKGLEESLNLAEKDLLRRVCDEHTAATAFLAAVDFATTFKSKEPNAKVIVHLMEQIPEILRDVCEVTPIEKYVKIKGLPWKADISKVLSLAYRVYDAWLL